MSTVINIRGSNGSGKSTLMRKFMAEMGKRTGRIAWDGRVAGYRFKYQQRTVFVVGKYETACGGLDASFSYPNAADDVCEIIRELAQHGDVIAEGVIAISSYGVKRMIQLATDLAAQGHHLVLATLDTPENVCIERVKIRRTARGNTKPFNPANLRSKFKAIHKDHDRLVGAGIDCRRISDSASLSDLILVRVPSTSTPPVSVVTDKSKPQELIALPRVPGVAPLD